MKLLSSGIYADEAHTVEVTPEMRQHLRSLAKTVAPSFGMPLRDFQRQALKEFGASPTARVRVPQETQLGAFAPGNYVGQFTTTASGQPAIRVPLEIVTEEGKVETEYKELPLPLPRRRGF